MTRRPGSGRTRRQAPGLALPADLGRSLRLLDDAQLHRLVKAVAEAARRRGRALPGESRGPGQLADNPGPTKPARAKSGAANRAANVTPGQERLILAALEAGLKPAAIAREFRVSRATMQHVITAAQRKRREADR